MAKDVEEKEDHEPEMVVIEEGSDEHRAMQEREEDDRDGQGSDDDADERLGKSETSEDDRQEHQLYGRRREGETDEQYRERRRSERKQKKANRQAAINRNRTELRFLESRNETLERENAEIKKRLSAVENRTAQTQVITLDSRISQAEQQLQECNTLMAAAVDANNGEDVVKCQEIRDHLTNQIRGMKQYKQHLENGGAPISAKGTTGEEKEERRPRSTVQPPKDPKIAKHSQSFQERLDWFDPTGQNPESATVYAIDTALAKDARFDPRTPKYWDELERRVRAALPHMFEQEESDDDDDDGGGQEARPAQRSRGPNLPGSGRSAKGGTTFYLSAERKAAMVELGVYDDPVLRKKYINKYREWDRQNAVRR